MEIFLFYILLKPHPNWCVEMCTKEGEEHLTTLQSLQPLNKGMMWLAASIKSHMLTLNDNVEY